MRRYPRDYSKIYRWRRFVLQIIQDGQYDGITVRVFPTVSVSFNNPQMHFALGLEWLTGDVCFGFARKIFVEGEETRREWDTKHAATRGMTLKEWRGRHRW